jgi:hypothetical protein
MTYRELRLSVLRSQVQSQSGHRLPWEIFSGLLLQQLLVQLLIYPYKGSVDPVPDPLLLRKSGSAVNRTRDLRVSSQELWPLDHRGVPRTSTSRRKFHICKNLQNQIISLYTPCIPTVFQMLIDINSLLKGTVLLYNYVNQYRNN